MTNHGFTALSSIAVKRVRDIVQSDSFAWLTNHGFAVHNSNAVVIVRDILNCS